MLWDGIENLKNPVWWVGEVVCEVWLRSRSRPNEFVCGENVEIFSVPQTNRFQLYVDVPSWWRKFDPLRALVLPTPTIFAYNNSCTVGPALVDADIRNLASCEMCAIVLHAFWEFDRSGVVDRFAHDPSFRLYTYR